MAYMPLPEKERRPDRQPDKKPEQEQTPYYRAARFKGEEPAGKAYFKAQEAIFNVPECDVSTYRFHINRIWHVAALGDSPPEALDQKLQEILSTGEPVSLPPNLLKLLTERRRQATRQGPWIERHYWPGRHYQTPAI
jgi:hypothetical protein